MRPHGQQRNLQILAVGHRLWALRNWRTGCFWFLLRLRVYGELGGGWAEVSIGPDSLLDLLGSSRCSRRSSGPAERSRMLAAMAAGRRSFWANVFLGLIELGYQTLLKYLSIARSLRASSCECASLYVSVPRRTYLLAGPLRSESLLTMFIDGRSNRNTRLGRNVDSLSRVLVPLYEHIGLLFMRP